MKRMFFIGLQRPNSANGGTPHMSDIARTPSRDAVEFDSSFEPLLGSDEAAQLLKIHPKTLQRMARQRQIPGIQIGKLWRFRGSQLNPWIDKIIARG
jgi:excisionase family DNA binding protein